MKFGVLGPLVVNKGGKQLKLGGPKQRAVLAMLLVEFGQPVSTDALIDGVWGENPPAAAKASVQSYISNLRSELDVEIARGAGGYRLSTDPDYIDAEVFRRLVAEATGLLAIDPARAAATATTALGLWRGHPFADLVDIPGIESETRRLLELRLEAVEARLDAQISLGRYRQAAHELDVVTTDHPYREGLWAKRMIALYGDGRQTEALRVYQQARELLRTELGIDPSPHLIDTERRILDHDPSLLTGEESNSRPHNHTLELSVALGRSMLGGYELRERIGTGPHAEVYAAYQPSAGREVTIKVFRPAVSNQPSFVRRFEPAARALTRLHHPGIVPVLDSWRDHEGAYLVTPRHAGTSAASWDTVSKSRLLDIAVRIGEALTHAHAHDVAHRNVKPSNVLVDAEGNVSLVDFLLDPVAQNTPSPYRPSEVDLLGDERTSPAAADVYGMARLVTRLTTGDPLAVDRLPPKLGGVVGKAVRDDPGARHQSIASLVEAIVESLENDDRTDGERPVRRNPFKGLEPFDTPDAPDFFGRRLEIDDLKQMVRDRKLVFVVGPSGSGKSSLVRAGLVAQLASDGSDHPEWLPTTIIPGRWPMANLAKALETVSTVPLGDAVATLGEDGDGLDALIRQVTEPIDGRVLLIIDQFEELYTLATPDTRNRFVAALLRAIDDDEVQLHVVATLRADFFDRPLTDEGLGPRIRKAVLPISVPDATNLMEAIEKPADRAGLVLDRGLAARIVIDVQQEPGALPLLQYVMTSLVDSSLDGTISTSSYEDLGGVRGAIGERAAAVFDEFDPAKQAACERIFLRLVSVVDNADDIRRRVRRSELYDLGLSRHLVDNVLSRFGEARLLTFDCDTVTRGPTVEVAHEALFRDWPRLRSWIADKQQSLAIRQRFNTALDEWAGAAIQPGIRPDDLLPTGGRLVQFEEWAEGADVVLTSVEREFLSAALTRRDSELEERRRRRRRLMAAFASAAVLSGMLAVVALIQRNSARSESELADARGLILEAEQNLDVDAELATMLSLEAIEAYRNAEEVVPARAVNVVRQGIAGSRVLERHLQPSLSAMSADGRSFVSTRLDGGGLTVWDMSTRSPRLSIDELAGKTIQWADFLGNDHLVVFLGPQGDMYRLDLDTGELDADPPFGLNHRDFTDVDGANRAAYSPSGQLVALRLSARNLEVWDVESRTQLFRLGGAANSIEAITIPAFSPDSATLAFGTDDGERSGYRIVDSRTGEVRVSVDNVSIRPFVSTFSPDGTMVAVSEQSGVAVLDTVEGRELWAISNKSWGGRPRWSPDGQRIFVEGQGAIGHYDAASGRPLSPLAVGVGLNLNIAGVDPVSEVLVSSGEFGMAFIDSSLEGRSEIGGFDSPVSVAIGAWLSPTGSRFLHQGPTEFAIQDAVSGEVFVSYTSEAARYPNVWQFAVGSNNGRFLAGFTNDRNQLWDAHGPTVLHSEDAQWSIRGISDDGRYLYRSSDERGRSGLPAAQLIDVATGEVVFEPDVGPFVHKAYFTSDNSYVITGNNGEESPHYRIFAIPSGEFVAGFGTTVDDSGLTFALSDDDRYLVLGHYDGTVSIHDFAAILAGRPFDQTRIREMSAHDNLVLSVRISPDNRFLATNTWDEPAKVWELETGQLVAEFDGAGAARAIAFHPTKPHVYVYDNGRVSIHTLDVDELLEIAESRLTRAMTQPECEQYLGRACDP